MDGGLLVPYQVIVLLVFQFQDLGFGFVIPDFEFQQISLIFQFHQFVLILSLHVTGEDENTRQQNENRANRDDTRNIH
jgi:hypothetical protein